MAEKEEQRLKGQNNVGFFFFCQTIEVKSLYLHTPLAVISTLEPKACFFSGGCGTCSSSHSSKPGKKTQTKLHF